MISYSIKPQTMAWWPNSNCGSFCRLLFVLAKGCVAPTPEVLPHSRLHPAD